MPEGNAAAWDAPLAPLLQAVTDDPGGPGAAVRLAWDRLFTPQPDALPVGETLGGEEQWTPLPGIPAGMSPEASLVAERSQRPTWWRAVLR